MASWLLILVGPFGESLHVDSMGDKNVRRLVLGSLVSTLDLLGEVCDTFSVIWLRLGVALT